MNRSLTLAACLLPCLASAQQTIEHYQLSSQHNITLQGAHGSQLPPGTYGQRLEFEFQAHNYFGQENIGHMTIGVRGESIAVGGRGIVIGNLTEYGSRDAACQPTTSRNVIAIESYWSDGNCVYGSTSQSSTLSNDQRYKVVIDSATDGNIGYKLFAKTTNNAWQLLDQIYISDTFNYKVEQNLSGWWIAEVFSTHQWTVDFYNIKTRLIDKPNIDDGQSDQKNNTPSGKKP